MVLPPNENRQTQCLRLS